MIIAIQFGLILVCIIDLTLGSIATGPALSLYTSVPQNIYIVEATRNPCISKNVLHDHAYQRKEKTFKSIGTQTSPSDFISEANVKFYTGLANLTVFLTLVEGLKSFLPARKFKNILIQDQILLVLLRLRLGLLF